MRRHALAIALLVLSSAAGAAPRGRARDLAAYTPVPGARPETCIPVVSIRESRVIDDSTIDFHVGGRKVYRNHLPHSCPRLGFERAFSYATSLTQLCSVDIITVLNQAAGSLLPGASCGLGEFQPMQKVQRP